MQRFAVGDLARCTTNKEDGTKRINIVRIIKYRTGGYRDPYYLVALVGGEPFPPIWNVGSKISRKHCVKTYSLYEEELEPLEPLEQIAYLPLEH